MSCIEIPSFRPGIRIERGPGFPAPGLSAVLVKLHSDLTEVLFTKHQLRADWFAHSREDLDSIIPIKSLKAHFAIPICG